MTIFRFTLIKSLKHPLTLILNSLFPLVLIFIAPMWRENSLLGYRLIIMALWGGGFLISQGILNDRTDGAIIRILAAPVSMLGYLTQSLLAFILPLILQSILMSAFGILLYDWDILFALALALCNIVFVISSVALGFAWSCLFKDRENSSSIFLVVITFGASLSGVLFPLELLPRPLQFVGTILPSYWAVRGIDAIYGADRMFFYWAGLLVMLAMSSCCLFYGGKRGIMRR